MKTELLNVINEYLTLVRDSMVLFHSKIGDTPPLKAWKDNLLPQAGELAEGVEYEFHGIGCLLVFKDYEVDFDFGPDNRFDGFDLWRLTQYTSTKSKSHYHNNKVALERDFKESIEKGEISRSYFPNSNLYYFSK